MTDDIDDLQRWDARITAELKRPMPNLDRALLVADRKEIRAKIQELKAQAQAKEGTSHD